MGTCHSNDDTQLKKQAIVSTPEHSHSPKKNRSKSVVVKNTTKGKTDHRRSDPQLRNDELIHKVYRICSPPIGKGAFGEVRKALHIKSGQQRAIKIIKLDTTGKLDRTTLISEIDILKKVDHPNVVKILEYFENKNSTFIIMELIEGQPLVEYILSHLKELTQKKIAVILFQLMSALNYLHSMGIVHRDIKSDNLMYNGKNITLIDFGMSRVLKSNKGFEEIEGTALYMAPEILNSNGTEKGDLWASGVVMYILMVGCFPFSGGSSKEIGEKIKKFELDVPFVQIKGISPNAMDLLTRLLDPNPKTRITAKEALKHPILKESKSEVNSEAMGHVVQNLEKFVFRNELESAIYLFIADIFFAKSEEDELKTIFTEIDEDNSGSISKDEFRIALVKAGNIYSDEEIDTMFARIDVDESGTISFQEYRLASIDRHRFVSPEHREDLPAVRQGEFTRTTTARSRLMNSARCSAGTATCPTSTGRT